MSQEPDNFERLDDMASDQLDRLLLVPVPLYVIGLFGGGTEMLGIAVVAWLVATVIWSPWILIRVAMRTPRGDQSLAAAVLGLGLAPWLVCLIAMDWIATRTGLIVTFPIVFLSGAVAMWAAHFERPRLQTARARSMLLLGGSLAYGGFAVLLLGALALGVAEVAGVLTVGVVLFGGAAAITALALIREAIRRTPAPGR